MANPYQAVIFVNINGSNYLIKGHRVNELSRNQSYNPHETLCQKGHIQIEHEETENDIQLKWKVNKKTEAVFMSDKIDFK